MHNLKVENYVVFGGHTEDLSLGDRLSDALRNCSEEVREEPGYIGVFAVKTKWSEHQKITVNDQTPQVNEFSTFLHMGRCKSLGSLKSFFDMHLTYLGPVSCFFPIPNPLRAHSLGWLQGLIAWWPQHPLFTDMAGDFLCPWYLISLYHYCIALSFILFFYLLLHNTGSSTTPNIVKERDIFFLTLLWLLFFPHSRQKDSYYILYFQCTILE